MATKLKVNYEFVGDSTTPVTRTESIKHGDNMLSSVITSAVTALGTKADKSYVDSQDALKANKTYVDTELAKKANATDVTSGLAAKADSATVSAIASRVSTNETNIATQTARIDEIAALPEGSTSGDAELMDIRVGADGKTYTSAGNAVRGQISDVKSDLSNIVTSINVTNAWKDTAWNFNQGESYNIKINVTSGTGALYAVASDSDYVKILDWNSSINKTILFKPEKNYTICRYGTSGGTINGCILRVTYDDTEISNHIDNLNKNLNNIYAFNNVIGKMTKGGYIDTSTGQMVSNAGWYYSDYIPVTSEKFVVNGIALICYYDENKNYYQTGAVSGYSQPTEITNPNPSVLKYIRFSTANLTVNSGIYMCDMNSFSKTAEYNNQVCSETLKSAVLGISDSQYGNDTSVISNLNDCKVNHIYTLLNSTNVANMPHINASKIQYVYTNEYICNGNTWHAQYVFNSNYDLLARRINTNGTWSDWTLIGSVEIIVDKNGSGDFTSFTQAIDSLKNTWGATVKVKNGVYNLVEEYAELYGGTYLDSLTVEDTYGINVGRDITIEFESNAKIVFNYTGSNSIVLKYFSPLNTFDNTEIGGVTLINVNIECSRCRYAMHDEHQSDAVYYHNQYIGCNFKCDNTNNPYWNNAHCIGGGLGQNAFIEIRNCVFNSIDNGVGVSVSYHNCRDSADAKSRIIIDGNYFENGTIALINLGSYQTKSDAIIINNNVPTAIKAPDDTSSPLNITMRAWNNIVRS